MIFFNTLFLQVMYKFVQVSCHFLQLEHVVSLFVGKITFKVNIKSTAVDPIVEFNDVTGL